MATMNLLDELTIETSDYEFRKSTNALRKWKYDMFLVNQEYKQYRFRRGDTTNLKLNGAVYNKEYIAKLKQITKTYTLPSADILKTMIFGLNDGKDFAEEVIYATTKFSHQDHTFQLLNNEKGWYSMTDEDKSNMADEFLQIVNAVIISLKPIEMTKYQDGTKYMGINLTHFWDELERWYIYNGKFWRYDKFSDEPQDIPINTETNEKFHIGNTIHRTGNKFVNVRNGRNLTKIIKLILQQSSKTKTAFYNVPHRVAYKNMNYSRSRISFYDITNAKQFNDKGQASSKGLQANHLYTYHSGTHSCGWTFGGITAGSMETFVRQNGYIGKKMTYQECINWILKDMDFQDFTNRTPPEPKTKASKSKKAK